MLALVGGVLLIPTLGWACSCAESLPLCQILAEPGATPDGGTDSKIFVGRVISTSPATQEEAWALEAKYVERHPDGKGTPEGRSRFLLDLWGDTLSAESRQRVLAGPLQNIVVFSRLEVIEAFTGAPPRRSANGRAGTGRGPCRWGWRRRSLRCSGARCS